MRSVRLTVIQWHCGSLCAFLVSTLYPSAIALTQEQDICNTLLS
jgi:hypothetical protein